MSEQDKPTLAPDAKDAVNFSAEEVKKLQEELRRQSQELEELKKLHQKNGEEYQVKLEEVHQENVGIRTNMFGAQPQVQSFDDFIGELVTSNEEFEKVYGVEKRYSFNHDFDTLKIWIGCDLAQGMPVEHVKRIYAKELARYNIR